MTVAPERRKSNDTRPSRAVFWIGPLAALLGAAGRAVPRRGQRSARRLPPASDELDAADVRLDRLREERAELLLRAERLRSDPFEIETVARESLGMARPGEIVVRLPRSPGAAPSEPRLTAERRRATGTSHA